MKKEILSNRKKGRFNPDLGHQVNEEFERAKARGELENKLRRTEPEKVIEEIERPDFGDMVIDDNTMDELDKAYMNFMNYNQADKEDLPLELIERINPTKSEIEAFAYGLVSKRRFKDFEWATSLFLTAIIQVSDETEFVLDFTEVNKDGGRLVDLGIYMRNKKIKIIGDAGHGLAKHAENCIFWVTRDAYKNIGHGAWDCKIFIDRHCYGVSKNIGRGCEVYEKQDNGWRTVHPT